MKKVLVMVMMAIMFVFGSVCFASTDGRDLDAQQKIVDIFLTGKSYAAIKPYMTDEYIKIFSEKDYLDMFSSMNQDLGKLQEKDMLIFQKIKDGDVLRYAAKFEKANLMEIVAVFKITNGKSQLIGFNVFPPKMQQQQQNTNQQK